MDLLQVINEAFREIFQSMSEGIIMVHESGKIAVANPVAEKVFGYGKNELAGLTVEDLLPEKYRGGHKGFRTQFNANPVPRRMGAGRDLIALRKDGTEFPVEISLSYTTIKDEMMVMVFISDISLRKNAENALRQSEEQLIVYAAELEQKVHVRTEALNTSVAKLEREIIERKKAEEEAKKSLERERELNELKTKFVSIASHEFRTPLSTVLSSASLIQKYKDKGDLDKVDKHVQRIKSSVNHLTSILNDFLSLGKLEEGKVEIQKERIDLEEFLHEIHEDVRSFLKEGQQIHVKCNGAIKHIDSDPRIIRNIMFNLLSNASKYSEPHKNIFLSCSEDNEKMFFTIKDEGIGIPMEDQKHLFDRFFRASNAGNVQGTGLGLNIVRRYAELLEGEITFTSEYGEGSTFTLGIPAN
jgi:PAS domain S-box-containing protein